MSSLERYSDQATHEVALPGAPLQLSRARRWDSPWMNGKLLVGLGLIGSIVILAILGQLLWNTDLIFVGRSPQNLPPVGFANSRGQTGTWDHPLGTEAQGRDILALLIVGAPRSLLVGAVAALIGIAVGVALGFTAGFLGGRVDDVIRLFTDTVITIPPLLVLIVIQAVIPDVSLLMMALLLALFSWPGTTRGIRAQVLSMRESGYVQMARLSGAPTFDIMFKEMMPNLLPLIAASYITGVSGAILASVGLELLGLGPQRVPTLGVTVSNAVNQAAVLRGLWWWWGVPAAVLILIFISLLLINLGLDEVANPRLRGTRER